MTFKVNVGVDVEFMAYWKGKPFYPVLEKDFEEYMDNFGHCVEVRPQYSNDKFEFMANIERSLSEVKEIKNCKFVTENVHLMKQEDFREIIYENDGKDAERYHNIYGFNCLDKSEEELELERSSGKRCVMCGTHLHISTTSSERIEFKDSTGKWHYVDKEVKQRINPALLTKLFDWYIYCALESDKYTNIGRYRSPGFFKVIDDSHFEYRSLPSTAFTPKRMSIIFDMVQIIVNNMDRIILAIETESDTEGILNELKRLNEKLCNSKPVTSDIVKSWIR